MGIECIKQTLTSAEIFSFPVIQEDDGNLFVNMLSPKILNDYDIEGDEVLKDFLKRELDFGRL
jgi:hypothetical protein